MRLALVIVGALALSGTGCAWMFKGSKQEVEFVSNPEGADVRVDSRYLGATPTKGDISRNNAQNIVISKDGYEKQYARVQRHPDTPWWFWDIGTCVFPIALCIPLLVDAISGAWMSLDDDVRVKLDATAPPATMKAAPAPTSVNVNVNVQPTPPAPAPVETQ